VRDLERVVRVGVDTEVFDFVERDGLVLGGGGVGRSVALFRVGVGVEKEEGQQDKGRREGERRRTSG
jgi:hypothetical protein